MRQVQRYLFDQSGGYLLCLFHRRNVTYVNLGIPRTLIRKLTEAEVEKAVRRATSQTLPGIAVEATFSRGLCASGRIIVHYGLHIDEDSERFQAVARDAQCFHFAFYPKTLLSNGREPHDQLMLAAYLPLSYAALRSLEVPGYGALLLQSESNGIARDVSVKGDGFISDVWTVTSEAELKRVLLAVAERAGINTATLISDLTFLPALPAAAA